MRVQFFVLNTKKYIRILKKALTKIKQNSIIKMWKGGTNGKRRLAVASNNGYNNNKPSAKLQKRKRLKPKVAQTKTVISQVLWGAVTPLAPS